MDRLYDFFLKRCFSPQEGHDQVVTIKSRNFSIARFGVVCFFFIDVPGVVIWQYIHPSTLIKQMLASDDFETTGLG